ncbi:type II toxin-antitoxin system PemK/MazF family toxin [Planococcus sp. SE5232]|uniref:type II toxin-antitoxin system PemK/MazF family toxin n=1 Tax=unclassified Planococcus (in: firmicutes) TaxID=2662419 RepID=UPI003D6ACC7D
MGTYMPAQGDLIYLNFDPSTDMEIQKRRPAIVLSNTEYNEKSTFIFVCPITSKSMGHPMEVEVPSGLNVSGFALPHQMKSVDYTKRDLEYKDTPVTEDFLDECVYYVKLLMEKTFEFNYLRVITYYPRRKVGGCFFLFSAVSVLLSKRASAG